MQSGRAAGTKLSRLVSAVPVCAHLHHFPDAGKRREISP